MNNLNSSVNLFTLKSPFQLSFDGKVHSAAARCNNPYNPLTVLETDASVKNSIFIQGINADAVVKIQCST